jgi:hypothetical protein
MEAAHQFQDGSFPGREEGGKEKELEAEKVFTWDFLEAKGENNLR